MADYLTPHFTVQEMIRSSFASRKGYDNTPTPAQRKSLGRVCEVLETLRNKAGGHSLFVSSGLRKGRVNDEQGGARNSAHKKGLAADLDNLPVSNYTFFHSVLAPLVERRELPIDQAICEFMTDPHELRQGWVHIGLADEGRDPRYQILRAVKQSGRTRYIQFQHPYML